MKKLGKFAISDSFTKWKGITKENHLGAMLQAKPQLASNIMTRLLSENYGKSFDAFLSQFPTKEFATDDDFYWEVLGSVKRNIPLVEARDEDGNVVTSTSGMIGAGTQPFELVFGEDWFADGEIIVGNLNEQYQFRLLGEGRPEGSNTVYKVELMGGNINGCPADRLLAGERFSIEFAPVEKEFSREVGDVRFSTPTEMRNEWSVVRIHTKVAGNMIDKKLAFGIPMVVTDENGVQKNDVANKWMHYEDFELEKQFEDYKNNAMVFGRSNRNVNGEYTNVGKSGGVIKTGQGLFEQLEAANTIYYPKFSLSLIEKALYGLLAGKVGFKNRKVVMKTGEWGALQFHKAAVAEGWGSFTMNGDALGVVKKTSSPLHDTALSVGYQFTEVRCPNNLVLSIEVDPAYDDDVRNKIMHSSGNGVAMSYRYDIMDMGTSEEPNIQKCAIAGRPEVRSYVPGIRNPFTGEWNVNYAATDEDATTVHKMAWLGVLVKDPTRTVSIIPNELIG